MLYYTKTAQQALKELGTTRKGLSDKEVAKRQQLYGLNVIKVTGEPLWRKLIEPFIDIFMLVLLIAAAVSIWHKEYLDGFIIIAIMATSAIIYYVQRFSTERILRSLQKRNAQTVTVLRNNKHTTLDASMLVPGDIIVLNEGEKVPADGRVIESSSLRVDESQLTGESLPISKQTEKLAEGKEVYEQSNILFQGSFVVSGEGMALVVATGNTTEFGQLAALTKNAAAESPVQKKINKLLTQIIAVVSGLALIAFALSLFRGVELTESLRFVMALSVSAVPEGLPVAISVILVLGMRRMAAKKALVRDMRAIETIGVITTIATDKTGTLTKNKLTVQQAWQPKNTDIFHELISKAVNKKNDQMHDPLDTAFHMYAKENHVHNDRHKPLTSFPFDHATSMSGNLWHMGEEYELVVKGAPEKIILISDLSENEREQTTAQLHRLTSEGFRVIALAHTTLDKPIENLAKLSSRSNLQFDGFVAVADILHPEAKPAIQAALRAGVSVRMITGDHFETAYHIGRQLNMVTSRDQVFDSRKMNVMSDEELEKVIDTIRVFSRVTPEHKYRILTLLKKHNITAMTGDGVNDVPALTNAHVGVAMGSGAGIAKDAGDIILLDDNFKSIVDAMREGRAIFANIRRMLFYLLSTNAGEALTMIGSLVIGMPIPLAPVQILWVNLVTDTCMVIPLGLEPDEKTNMTAKPKKPNAPILNKLLIWRMILIAVTMAIVTLGLYAYYSDRFTHEYAQTIAFNALVVMQWANAFSARSENESLFLRLKVMNTKFYIGLIAAIGLQVLVLFGPLSELLHVTHVTLNDLIITSVISFIVPIVLAEIHKFIGHRSSVRNNNA